MTEDEAKEKWCLMAMSAPNEWSLKCQGSDCMAWVWDCGYAQVDGVYHSDVQLNTGHCGMVK